MTRRALRSIYRSLKASQGHQHWWPGDSPFEIVVGAVLTQNTSWRNVEKAIANLARARRLDPHRLLATRRASLQRLLRPAGYFRVKERRLRAVVSWLVDRHGGDVRGLRRGPLDRVRDELLGVHGVGPETADSILLYAAGRPTFVVDAYTRRILGRLGLLPRNATYAQTKSYFEANLPRDVRLFNDFHAQLVRLGNTRCRPKPRCGGCPLEARCPVPRGAAP